MPKQLEVKVKQTPEGLFEAELDGTKFLAPNREDIKTLATWSGTRPTWNKEKQVYEGSQYDEPISAPTLAGLRASVNSMPDEHTHKILQGMPEYPTLYLPSRTKQFDKRITELSSCYENADKAKSVARESGKNYVFELMDPKGIIKQIDRAGGGVFKIKPLDVPNAAIKRALNVGTK